MRWRSSPSITLPPAVVNKNYSALVLFSSLLVESSWLIYWKSKSALKKMDLESKFNQKTKLYPVDGLVPVALSAC